jgi:hypothetical protein
MAQDIILDEENDLAIVAGDLVVGLSQYQHVKHLLEAEKGYYKFSPLSGVGFSNILNDEFDSEEVLRLVRFEVERDGFKVSKLTFTNDGKIDIDGDYES